MIIRGQTKYSSRSLECVSYKFLLVRFAGAVVRRLLRRVGKRIPSDRRTPRDNVMHAETFSLDLDKKKQKKAKEGEKNFFTKV